MKMTTYKCECGRTPKKTYLKGGKFYCRTCYQRLRHIIWIGREIGIEPFLLQIAFTIAVTPTQKKFVEKRKKELNLQSGEYIRALIDEDMRQCKEKSNE